MAKITRQNHIIFGGDGTTPNFVQFGSTIGAGSNYTKDIETLEALDAWANGFQDAVYPANKAPFLEETNAVLYVHSYQVGYLLQEGVAEWNADTTYYIGSIAKRGGTSELYGSLVDDNIGNAIPVQADDANWEWLNPPVPEVPAVGNSLKEALVVTQNAGAPATKVDVTATRLSVEGVVLTDVNKTADITVVGANGLDAGAAANDTWYALFVITNDDGSLVASLLSLSGTAPTLPVGYTKARRVDWRRYATAAFKRATRIGDWVWYNDAVLTAFNNPGLAQSFASVVPTTSQVMKAVVFAQATSTGADHNFSLTSRPTGAAYAAYSIATGFTTAGNGGQTSNVQDLRLSSAQTADFVDSALSAWALTVLAYQDIV